MVCEGGFTDMVENKKNVWDGMGEWAVLFCGFGWWVIDMVHKGFLRT